jgi:uncharacterized membrane protein YpjA
MRYTSTEQTFILANFPVPSSPLAVTIDVYKLSNDTKVVDGVAMVEVGSTGIWKYELNQVIASKEEFLWIATNTFFTKTGKIVMGGYTDAILKDTTFLALKGSAA